MLYKNVGTNLFRYVTIHAFDRQTDGQTDGQTERPCQYRALHYMKSIKTENTFLNLATRLLYIFVLLHLLLYFCTAPLSRCKGRPLSCRDDDYRIIPKRLKVHDTIKRLSTLHLLKAECRSLNSGVQPEQVR